MAEDAPSSTARVPAAPSSPDAAQGFDLAARRRYALGAFVLLALIWGLSWPLMKMTLEYTEPFSFAALRGVLAAAALMALLPILRRPIKPPPLRWTALLGLLQTAGFSGLSYWALESGGSGRISVLTYTMPFWLLLMAWAFLGERVRGLQWLAILLALAGLVFILSPWELRGVASSLLAIATGVSWAASAVVAKLIHRRYTVDVLSLTAWQMVLGCVPLLIVAFATGIESPHWTLPFVALLVYQVVLSNAVAWIIWLFVLKVLPAGTTGLASLANPVLGVLFSWLILHEQPVWVEAVGMALVLAGIAVLTLRGVLQGRQPRSLTQGRAVSTACDSAEPGSSPGRPKGRSSPS